MRRFVRVALGLLLLSTAAAAQQYVISTYAGGAPPPTPAPAVAASIGRPFALAADAPGNVYFASADLHSVFKVDQSGVLTRVAGKSRPGFSGDGGPATSAQLSSAFGVAVDRAGNVFIADSGNYRIRKVSPDGIIATVAGNGGCCYSGDGGPATSASLSAGNVAVDGAGNLFFSGGHRIRRVSPSGIITTVAGTGMRGFSGDGGPATGAQLLEPAGVAVDGGGNLFIADRGNHRIRKVSPNGIITTVAGNGMLGFSGDGEPAASTALWYPWGVLVDGAGNLFISDGSNHRIRKVSPDGIISTVAGNGTGGFSGDGASATSAQLRIPLGLALDGAGNLFIADWVNLRIRRVSASGIITTVAGDGTFPSSFSGDGGPATSAQLRGPSGVAVDGGGNLFIADRGNQRIRKVSASGIITTVAGNRTPGFSGDGGQATTAQLREPNGVAVDAAGNLFIADSVNNRIRKVTRDGIITTVAGNGTPGFSGDGGPATSAQLSSPLGVGVDSAGNLFIADPSNHRIRKVSPGGIITTVAGNGTGGFSGDGGPASSAQLGFPTGVAVDGAGDLFIVADGNRIRKVTREGIINTVAGGGTEGLGDGGPATSAGLWYIAGVAVDGAGNLFIATSRFLDEEPDGVSSERVRKVSHTGIITTVAGTGTGGFSGDGGPATSAQLSFPAGLAVDGAGNIYVADSGNHAVRILRPIDRSVWIGAVVDAASQRADPVSPGKIVVIYGAGLGPTELIQNQPRDGLFSTELAGTTVSFNGIAAPILYTSATGVAAIVPYAITGTTAQVTVTYQGQVSATLTVPVTASAPSLFTLNQTGAGQAAAINAVDGTVNTAANPVKIGGYISLYATGEGQTEPGGLDGRLAGSTPPRPVLQVKVTVGGVPATVQYAGGAPGFVAGLMQVNVQIPSGVQPGGYVPLVLQVGERTSSPAVWIAVSGN